jgi:hypothetical protein
MTLLPVLHVTELLVFACDINYKAVKESLNRQINNKKVPRYKKRPSEW